MTWSADPSWWPFVFILLAASLPTMGWRWLAVAIAADIDEDSELLIFVRCLSTALVAAVAAQFIFFPNGALAETSFLLRGGAAVAGFSAYLISRSLFVGILVGEVLLVAGMVLN
ncbi:AzlD domain-containing protein [Pseudahrensia aquimaris]|uniref:AzlD domain-containing protein n=1 Tax=Pseudahrensia aquimaris TaxID=744461 RepID=A0ABW3FHT7_9HYPH